MKRLLRILFCLVLTLVPALGALAQAPTPLNLIKEGLQPGTTTEQPPVLPEPAALEPSWWRYFEADGATLESRVQAALKRLDALAAELPADVAGAAAPFLQLLRANLQALPQARSQTSAEPPAPTAYAPGYRIDQVLDLDRRRRELERKLETERNEVQESDRSLKSSAKRIDTLFAAYLASAPSDPQRVVKGLEIMAERTALALAEERLRLRRAELQADEVRAARLAQEVEVASERLQARPDDPPTLNVALEEAKRFLEQAQNRHVRVQARAQEVLGDDPQARAIGRLRQQQVLRAAVDEADAEIQLIALEARTALTALLLDQAETIMPGLRARLADRSARLGELKTKLAGWIADSERERGRTDVAATPGVEPGAEQMPAAIRQINQERFQLAQETLVEGRRLQLELDQAELLLRLVDEQLLAKEGRLRDWLARAEQILEKVWTLLRELLTASLFKIGETPVTALGLLRIALILTIAWWISYWLRKGLIQLGERGEGVNLPAFYTIARLSHYLIIILGFIVGLSSIGVDFTNFALVAGAVAIGIGFGLQSIVNNFVSGLILLFERSLKVGDFVELASGIQGEVREINVRSTLINTNDNVDIVVPNSEFMNTKVTNWTLLEAYRRIHLPFRVAYGTDKERVRQAVLEAAEALPHTLRGIPGRNPAVWLVGFGENGYDFELVVWITPRAVKRPSNVHAAYMWEIDTALRKHNIPVPLPQRDLHLKSGFGELVEAPAAAPLRAVARRSGSARQSDQQEHEQDHQSQG
ncbi:MAG TPA: mechanosensitive ion channel domain-containing protein [Candidatus Competibacteraceae bacterium]|nr:mechanosensitive ion channel domain-containing protein [Candidatus Competibacteraceae bacterium]